MDVNWVICAIIPIYSIVAIIILSVMDSITSAR